MVVRKKMRTMGGGVGYFPVYVGSKKGYRKLRRRRRVRRRSRSVVLRVKV